GQVRYIMVDDNTLSTEFRVSETEQAPVAEDTDGRDPVFLVSGVQIGKVRSGQPTLNPPFIFRPVIDAYAIHSCIYTDPADYPAPPIDEATFKTAIDSLATKITAAADVGKKAIADRNHQEEVVIKMMCQLGKYAETACKDDITAFLK